MKLSDRLAQAATDRRNAEAAGTTVEDWRRRQSGQLLPEPSPPPEDVIILVSGPTPVAAVRPDPLADPRSVCPTCARTGEMGMVDLAGRTTDWACNACGSMWRVTHTSAAGA